MHHDVARVGGGVREHATTNGANELITTFTMVTKTIYYVASRTEVNLTMYNIRLEGQVIQNYY